MTIAYKRVLLKLSGEVLMADDGSAPVSPVKLAHYLDEITDAVNAGAQVGIVIGGGNIFRGLGNDAGLNRISGDYMGMLATVINAMAVQAGLESRGIKSKVLSAIRMEPVAGFYSRQAVKDAFANGEVVVFAAGTGNPFFTTDTAAALRAVEMDADVLLKGTKVDGVYTADPKKDPTAARYENLSFDEAYMKNLKIMDLTAFALCKDNALPIIVFNIHEKGNLRKIIEGQKIGTIVK